jgi:tetratricopeptide (TPR) repeat protein
LNATLQQYLHLVGDRLRRQDVAGAMKLSEQAVSQGLEEPNLLVLAGQERMRLGRPEAALPLLVRARQMAPTSIETLNGLGLCLAQLGQAAPAVAAFDEAIALSASTAYLHLHKAQTLEDAGGFAAARETLEQWIVKAPGDAAALARLAGLCARRGEMAAARDYAQRTLAIAPLPAATIALAMADLEERDFEAALARLLPLAADPGLTPVNRSIILGLMGDAWDGLDKIPEAFASYARSRETLRAAFAPLFEGRENAVDRVRRIADHVRAMPAATGRPAGSDTPLHVFLVGFPRSGTTLLEQVLASHGAIQTLEERDCLSEAVRDFVDTPDGLDRLDATNDAGLARYRALYWQRAGGPPQRPVFVDKMPLNTIHLGVIARLFPRAKILFAIRDPRDVVLSCFRRRLVMTAHMYEFTQLAGAARFYDEVMSLAELYRRKLDLAILDLHHESLLDDFDGEVRRLCGFLGLDWDPAMRDFAAAARKRDIKTPSGLQVKRGLNADGAGQWQRYRTQLEPVLPILAPWVTRFGYE